MTPHTFLDLLWQHKPEELYVLLWTLQDKRLHWFRDVSKAGTFASNANAMTCTSASAFPRLTTVRCVAVRRRKLRASPPSGLIWISNRKRTRSSFPKGRK